MMKSLRTILTPLLICLVVLFAVQNAAMVEIQFLLWHFSMPRALLVVVLLAVGFALGKIFSD